MESSLDRFARTRGAAMLGQTALGRSGRVQTTVGAILLAGSGALAALPLFRVPAEVLYGAIGPAIAGGVNLGIGLWCRKSIGRDGPPVELSSEARGLLTALVVRAQVWQGGLRPMQGPIHARVAASEPPPRAAMDALERAAAAHNRLMDAIGGSHDERSRRLRAAGDAGMGEVLTQAARMGGDESPLLGRMDETIASLNELADRTEANLARPEGASGLRSTLDATLEELRAEDVAREELRG